MNSISSAWLLSFSLLLLYFHIAFIFAAIRKRNDYADVAWGPGFLVLGLGALLASGQSFLQLDLSAQIAFVLVALWSLRLAGHIGYRTLKKSKEDFRYAKMRQDWGQSWLIQSYLKVFVLQCLLCFLIALPFVRSILSPVHFDQFSILNWVGLGVAVFGLAVEAVADQQLKNFADQNKGKARLLTTGIWSWSRHPNYFGEVVFWWGFFFLTYQDLNGLWTIAGPVAIHILILKVSGVPMLEAQMKSRSGFPEYAAKTSRFVLWPPRRTTK